MWKVPLCTAQPAHESSLATYSLHCLRLATASISTSLTIMWRQCSFLPWLQRSNTRRADSMFPFSSLPFPTWESALVRGSEKAVAGRREALHASGGVDRAYTEGRKLSPRLPVLLQNHKDMPKILQPLFWHYYLSFHFPASKSCDLVTVPLLKDEQTVIPSQISSHLAMTFLKSLIINSFYNGHQYKSHLKRSLPVSSFD